MRQIRHCLNPKLKSICTQAIELEEFNRMLKSHLPQYLFEQCSVGSFNRGRLVLIASDATWATQLRFYLPELRDKLRKEERLYRLIAIEVVVRTTFSKSTSIIKKRKAISAIAKAQIIREANDFHYPPLKQAFLRLTEEREE